MAGEGLVVMAPSAVTVTGGGSETATIKGNGSVSFADCYTIRFDDVFSASYTNYMIVMRVLFDTDQEWAHARLSSGGSPQTDSNYNHQYLNANGGTVGAGRVTGDSEWRIDNFDNDVGAGVVTMYLAAPSTGSDGCSFRTLTGNSYQGARKTDVVGTRNAEATTYDGFLLFTGGATAQMEGNITFFGLEE